MSLKLKIEKQHLVQSKDWNSFKKSYGTKIEKIQNIYFLIKEIPGVGWKMGYAPKPNILNNKINWKDLKNYCISNNIAFVRFDVPNHIKNSIEGKKAEKILKKYGKRAPRNTFTQKNILLDLTPTLDELLKQMHSKKRYNIKYAQKKGINVEILQTKKAFENFWILFKKTAERQKFLIHPKDYYKKVAETLEQNVYFVQASFNSEILTSWMIIKQGKTIYYVYGGSAGKYNNLFPNDLVGFKAIELGKHLGAETFDMWGAEEGKGFTEFKLKYGAELVEFLPTYDYVIKPLYYNFFNIIYEGFWYAVKIKKAIGL